MHRRIGLGVNSCSRYDVEYYNLVHEFQEIFSGIGLLKDREVKLNQGVIEFYYSLVKHWSEGKPRYSALPPHTLWLAKDIIEPVLVDEVSSFVSPVVVAP